MLKDEDRIFKNLYNDLGWEIDSALKTLSLDGLKMYDGISHQSMFQLPKYTRTHLNTETRVITNSNPIFTYQQ